VQPGCGQPAEDCIPKEFEWVLRPESTWSVSRQLLRTRERADVGRMPPPLHNGYRGPSSTIVCCLHAGGLLVPQNPPVEQMKAAACGNAVRAERVRHRCLEQRISGELWPAVT